MKIAKLILTTVLILSFGFLMAQSFSVKEAEMTVSGTSTLHEWTSTVGQVTAKGDLTLAGGELKGISKLNVTISAKSIKSTKGKTMDNKTYEALKADANPNITYQLTEVKSIEKTTGGYKIKANGKLTIAGETRPVELAVTGKVLGEDSIQFSGSKALKMSDFKMEAPTALLGTIKTGDEVTINFSVTLTSAPTN